MLRLTILVIAGCLAMLPLLAAAFWDEMLHRVERLPAWKQVTLPVLLAVPYVMVSTAYGIFQVRWLCEYALLPVVVAALMFRARRRDPKQRGTWLDAAVLLVLGLVVDLHWMQPAWPAQVTAFNKVLLLDAGIYGFMAVRRLSGIGLNMRLRLSDLLVGLREYAIYAAIAAPFGLVLGFLHFHVAWPGAWKALGLVVFTYCFIAIPEELFFRGWIQNLLERRMGRTWSLVTTAVLFGLSHFNKLTTGFNWRYVLMATMAGVFYGRAWRQQRRVGASAITHAAVDTTWSLLLF